jgi:hypothetical protein
VPGLRILNVHPRLAGPISGWSRFFELAAVTGFNAVWLNPFHRATEAAFEEGGKTRSGSLYAIRNHFEFDAGVSSGDVQRDRADLKSVIAQARGLGVRAMVDLVLNHVALDHPMVARENDLIRQLRSGSAWELLRTPAGVIIGVEVRGSEPSEPSRSLGLLTDFQSQAVSLHEAPSRARDTSDALRLETPLLLALYYPALAERTDSSLQSASTSPRHFCGSLSPGVKSC